MLLEGRLVIVKLFLRTVFENIENIIFMFSENCSYFLRIKGVFPVFFVFKNIK